MINVVTHPKIAESNMAMCAMFAARKQVFVDLLKWDLPVLDDRFEIDQFDTPDARYLILLGADGQHRASTRLLPTTGPHILGDLYPHLCDGQVPRGPRILEISRFCLDRNQDAGSRLTARNQLVTALAILGHACDRIQLNVAQAIEIHPGELRQFPHRDHDMWDGAKGAHEYLVNVIWPLTAFRADNGATQIYPDSHGARGIARKEPGQPVIAECEPGAAICFLGSTAHGAGANVTSQVRRGVVIGYSLGWLKPYENLWLAYPPSVARTFPPDLAALAGYVQHRPNLGNYEGRCPSVLLGDAVPENLGAVDALRPDQEEMLAAFAEQEHESR